MRSYFIAVIFFVHLNSLAQTTDYPWSFGIGYNAVDYQTREKHEYNLTPISVKVEVNRLLWNNFTAQFSLGFNKINNFAGDKNINLKHTALDIGIFYSFGSFLYLVGKDPIDPFLGISAGRTWLRNRNWNVVSNVLSLYLGANIWINPRLAIYFQGGYKDSTDIFADTYHEIVLGVKYSVDLSKWDR